MSRPKKYRSISDVYTTGVPYKYDQPEEKLSSGLLSDSYNQVLLNETPIQIGGEPPIEVTPDTINKIKRMISQIEAKGDEKMDELIKASKFSTKTYVKDLKYTISTYNINWEKFAVFADKKINDDRNPDVRLEELMPNDVGEFNLRDVVIPIVNDFIEEDGLSRTVDVKKQRTVIDPETQQKRKETYIDQVQVDQSAAESFFREIVDISSEIAGTSVGKGEFLLSLFTDGIKGTTGDIDVVKGPGGMTYEVGIMNKQIGGSERARFKGIKGLSFRDLWTILAAGESQLDSKAVKELNDIKLRLQMSEGESVHDIVTIQQLPENEKARQLDVIRKIIEDVFKGQPVVIDNYVDDVIVKLLQPASDYSVHIQQILGAIILFNYITQHEDDYIVVINYGSAMKKSAGGRESDIGGEYLTRYLKVKNNFQLTMNSIVSDNPWFIVTIDTGGTARIKIP